MEVCPNDAINPPIPPQESQQTDSAYQKIIRDQCDHCMKCVDACHYGALSIVGRPMSFDELLDEVEKDRPFYDNSGGGMTLSGGEPTAHSDFAVRLLKIAKQRGLHTCVDTNGFCDFSVLEKMLEHVDIFLFDLKHIDSAMHREKTGVDNGIILNNLARLSKTGKEIWIRIPVIPGFNDSVDFHKRAAEFLSNLPGEISRVDLLSYHNWCQDKYDWLGIDWSMKEIEATEPSFLEIPAEFYRKRGLMTTVGGSGFESASKAVGA
jgi:pyruvate formate lyase activating enzyme